ncbi:HAD-IIIA family hydrolase [Sphingomonas suaedae]
MEGYEIMTQDWRARRPALFLDRDGTLIEDEGYTVRVEDLRWLPGAIEAIRHANKMGALVFVVTNQSGIARGLYSEADMRAFHAHMLAQLAEHGARIDAFYHCPYHPDGTVARLAHADHPDRKPAPGMLRRALTEFPVDPARSVMIGDKDLDVEAGVRAGVRSVKVAPGALLDAVRHELAAAIARNSRAAPDGIAQAAREARAWLFDTAFPFWWTTGFDRRTGCFHEQIARTGAPVAMPRRVRVQARQTFVYARAGRLGWDGPWREAVEAGLGVLLERGLNPDGGTRHLLSNDGVPIDDRRDLYDLAFVLLALAEGGAALGGHAPAFAAANRLVEWLDANWVHPEGGYREGEIDPSLPRRQNPHMHLLEALLALHAATDEDAHLHRAQRLGTLARERLYRPDHCALPEYFADDLGPFPGETGEVIEPGHQFEWCYLLGELAERSGAVDPVAEALRATGEIYGVDHATGMVHEEVYLDGRSRKTSSRLWTHTERLKASLKRFARTGDPAASAAACQAFEMMMSYRLPENPALWSERRTAEGGFVDQAVPASSLYHITFALSELIAAGERLDGDA